MENNSIGKTAGNALKSGGFFVRNLLIITVAGLILRLFAAWEMASCAGGLNNALAPLSTSDLATYIKLGKECAAGNFPESFYYQPWYYAVFLPLCYHLGSFSLWMVIVIQSLLSGATIFLTGWCGKKIFSERAGLIAAGLCAISSSLILYVPFHQNETLQTFHLALLLTVTILALERRCWWLWGITGVIAGIAILTRGNIWLMIPVIIAGLWFSGRKNGVKWKNLSGHCCVFICMMLVIQLPFIIRNTQYAGKLTGPSTAANAVLALGNTPEAPAGGREPGAMAGSMVYPESYHRMMANTQGAFARSIPRQMWQWFCSDPLAFCELQFRKALLFWDGREIPNNVSLEFDGIMTSKVLRFTQFGRNFLIFALGVSGVLFFLGRAWRKREVNLLILYGFFMFFYLSVVVFYILSRFKAPCIPLLVIFGGGFLCGLWDMWHGSAPEKRWRTAGKIIIWLLIGFWFSCSAYNTYRQNEAAINRWIYPNGMKIDLNGYNIHYFDYGPFPFGGWSLAPLQAGSILQKRFSSIGNYRNALIGLMLRSSEPVTVDMLVNGVPHHLAFPATPPGKSDRRMVQLNSPLYNGEVTVQIISVSGGPVWAIYDIQRCYGRSLFNNEKLDGEWVIRAILPR
ncbi:MAG: glycosyltransferase family 39 protein [Lentisphaerae bacterium]|nr:glycosyltransferase family 39 protein [Lentisphaerota bacterium]